MKRKELSLGLSVGVVVTLIGALIASSAIAQQLATKWEYLSVSYSQRNSIFADNSSAPYEIVSADVEPYASLLHAITTAGCGENERSCFAENFKGRDHFLNLLGDDGWELIHLDNQSVEVAYIIDMLFKRPKQ